MSSISADQEQQELTRKQRREHARAQRRASEQAALANAAKRTRFTQLGIVVAVIVIGIIAVLISSGGSSSNHSVASGGAAARKLDGEITHLLAGIPQNGNALGRPGAPVTLQYFGDLECPVCRAFTVSALPSIISKQVRSGKLRIEYHSLETATREPEVFKTQQIAALAAGRQDKLWNYIETFYHEQGEEDSGYVTERFIQGIAAQVPGLALSNWSHDRGEGALAKQVEVDAQAANQQSLEGTPAFLLGRSGGAMKRFEPSSYTEPGTFESAIETLAKS
jgi:protein-disulfide isomerase